MEINLESLKKRTSEIKGKKKDSRKNPEKSLENKGERE